MTDSNPLPVRRVHLIFDLERGRLVAREFLRELSGQNWPLKVTGASKRDDLDPTHRELVMVETMRKAQAALVLVTPMVSTSRNVIENLTGVLVAGSTAHTQLPQGLHRNTVVGWDWGALKKALF